MKQKCITEGVFFEMAEAGAISDIIVQESPLTEGAYNVVGIVVTQKTVYGIRHARTNELRTWKRIDRLAAHLKNNGIQSFEVRFQKKQ